jgi:hypothetical protein
MSASDPDDAVSTGVGPEPLVTPEATALCLLDDVATVLERLSVRVFVLAGSSVEDMCLSLVLVHDFSSSTSVSM